MSLKIRTEVGDLFVPWAICQAQQGSSGPIPFQQIKNKGLLLKIWGTDFTADLMAMTKKIKKGLRLKIITADFIAITKKKALEN